MRMNLGQFGVRTPVRRNIATGNDNIDGILDVYRWKSKNVTFSFTNNFRNDYETNYPFYSTHSSSFQAFSRLQRRKMRQIINQEFELVSNLQLNELSGRQDQNATIRIAQSDVPKPAWAYPPHINGLVPGIPGDIWFNPDDFNRPSPGSYSYYGFLHELGHSLGLEHGHERNGVRNVALPSQRDSVEFSLMTYRAAPGTAVSDRATEEIGGFSQSLMMQDIAALQHMYGANYKSRASNTIYSFSTQTGEMFVNGKGQGKPQKNRIFRTVWDGNGTDTYKLSNFTRSISIDLNPGKWSNLDLNRNQQRSKLDSRSAEPIYARGHLFNALLHKGDRRSLIENAIAGSGNDRLLGNEANNQLEGRKGNDRLWGKDGKDTLIGQQGRDILVGGADNDFIKGDDGRDDLFGSDGVARGRGEVDRLIGGNDADIFHLGVKNTVFYRDNLNVGDRSFARILDFDAKGQDADLLKLPGSMANYRIRSTRIGQTEGIGVYWKGNQNEDLLAYITGDNLTVSQVRSQVL